MTPSIQGIGNVYRFEESGEPVECHICGEEIDMLDAVVERAKGPKGYLCRVHRACTKDGVERWNRENRPEKDPLRAERNLGWEWDI